MGIIKMSGKNKTKRNGDLPETQSIPVVPENRRSSKCSYRAFFRRRLVFRAGFTLVEILVVVGIITILMVATVIVINPTELLKQSRDSNRLSDMATLKTALSLFAADVATNLGNYGKCYTYMASSTATTGCTWFTTAATTTNVSSSRAIDSTGWVPINFQAISAGTPFRQIPIDPIPNSTSTFYSYAASGTTLFKLGMKTESIKFSTGGSADVESFDGGISTTTYEVGPGTTIL
jgi:prepilin-type N-terminal cleavage/methylation domain-containing protein